MFFLNATQVAMAEKTCSEEYAQRIKHRFRMVSMLEGLLLQVDCDDLRVRSGLDENEQEQDGFVYSFTLDRPWNWPSTVQEEGVPMFRLRLTPLPKKQTDTPSVHTALPCSGSPGSNPSLLSLNCCDDLAGLNCLDSKMIKITLPPGMQDSLPLLQVRLVCGVHVIVLYLCCTCVTVTRVDGMLCIAYCILKD